MLTRTPWHRRFRIRLALGGWLAAAGPALGTGKLPLPQTLTLPSAGQALFPPITAEALDRTAVQVPSQLEGKADILLLYWKRDQTAQLDTWTAITQAVQHGRFDVRVYRMLVSAPENALYRWWDNASLRAAETDPEMLHWSIPLYTDKPALWRSLHMPGDEQAVLVLLIDHTGHVLWRAQGASSAASRAGLQAAANAYP